MIPKQNCAFITYSTRPAAEKAVEDSFNKLLIKGIICVNSHICFREFIGHRIKVLWGRSQTTLTVSNKTGGSTKLANVPGLPERNTINIAIS